MSTTHIDLVVTTALPYCNGDLHLGHIIEMIQADIWVRFQRLSGKTCLFLSGEDAHGTAIMLSAQQQGVSPDAFIESVYVRHRRDLSGFNIALDCFYTTHSPENQALSDTFFHRLSGKGDIEQKPIQQAYDISKGLFLPDRFIKGICPRCGAEDQYGDNCEVCGATYTSKELLAPRSVLSDATPVYRSSNHYFFRLAKYQALLEKWFTEAQLQPQVINKLKEWFGTGLRAWDISRDAPYFGFLIPGTTNKYFYVWWDAPMGYMAACQHYLSQRGQGDQFDALWGKDSQAELWHFIGKDIVYFHALFWPALLHAAAFRMPTGIVAHGFLMINGYKMSKSRGRFVRASDYLSVLDPEYLRYYFATKLGSSTEDINFNTDDFVARVNADLVGKLVNIASRCASFLNKYFEGQLSSTWDDDPQAAAHFDHAVALGPTIAAAYQEREYHQVVRQVMQYADRINRYIEQVQPWVLAKQDPQHPRIQSVCTVGVNAFYQMLIYLSPILPQLMARSAAFLCIDASQLSWDSVKTPLLNRKIAAFRPLIQRIEKDKVEQLFHAFREDPPL